MDRHPTDHIAFVFGLIFTTVAAVTLAGLADVAEVDGGVAIGGTMVLAAVAVGGVTITNLRERRSVAVAGAPGAADVPADRLGEVGDLDDHDGAAIETGPTDIATGAGPGAEEA